MSIRIPDHIRNLRPYVAGKPIEELAREQGLTRIVKLASNENPLGVSPKAVAMVKATLEQANRYVDPSAFDLVHAIAARHGLRPEQVVCGAGTDSLLAYTIAAFTSVDEEVLTAEGTFIGLYVNTRKLNRPLRTVPLNNYRFDLTALADAVTEKTKIIYLANPNNPTGNIVTADEFEAFMKRVPEEVLVILDEAYFNYAVEHDGYPNGLTYDYPNLIVTRTFSKDYGLGGMRVGFAAGPPTLIRELYKVKLPFEPSFPAQQAAIAALMDDAFLERTLELNRRMMALMKDRFDELGLRYYGGQANFYLLVFPNEAFAVAFNNACLKRGLIVRHVAPFGLPEAVRINTGTEEETAFALDVIADVYPRLVATFANLKAEQIKG
ncbi:MAG: histidinol-phosphate transaminase [Candidatus Zixiibacteriota bacterium]|nr:MAG: histidinol-phosphate transaminase [candidate division Zixibacteria bacterium]